MTKTRCFAGVVALAVALVTTAGSGHSQQVAYRIESNLLAAPLVRLTDSEVSAVFYAIVRAQEVYFRANQRYASRIADLPSIAIPEGMHVTMTTGSRDGEVWWAVAAIHEKAPGSTWRASNKPSILPQQLVWEQ